MSKLSSTALIYLCLALNSVCLAAEEAMLQLPDWQVLEFGEKAFWATARSRLEVLPAPDDEALWELKVHSSVVDNSEELQIGFEPATGRVITRSRLSQGKGQRLKSYWYEPEFITRERRNPKAETNLPPPEWPVTYSGELDYPASAGNVLVTTPYMLVLLAHQLQSQGPGASMDVIVHTDLNFYRARLSCGNGIPINVDYVISGEGRVSGRRETRAVALRVRPEGTLAEADDFSLLGLQGDIILLFDRNTGLPLQIRGLAPRIGATEINLRSVTMRASQP